MGKNKEIRFGIKGKDDSRSATWKFFLQTTLAGKDELYVVCRELSVLKVSLHDSGDYRFAFTDDFIRLHPEVVQGMGGKKVLQKINPKTVKFGQELIFKIVIPNLSLSARKTKNNITWIPAPGDGKDIQVVIAITSVPIADWPGVGEGTKLLGGFTLKDGRKAWAVYFEAPSIPVKMAPMNFSPANMRNVLRGNRMLVIGDDENGVMYLYDKVFSIKYPNGKVAYFEYLLRLLTSTTLMRLPRGVFYDKFRHMKYQKD